MLHFVIGCAVVVGVWYQWILPERRRKAEAEIMRRHLYPMPQDETLKARKEYDRLWRRAGYPAIPKQAEPEIGRQPVAMVPFYQDSAVRFIAVLGAICVLVLIYAGYRGAP